MLPLRSFATALLFPLLLTVAFLPASFGQQIALAMIGCHLIHQSWRSRSDPRPITLTRPTGARSTAAPSNDLSSIDVVHSPCPSCGHDPRLELVPVGWRPCRCDTGGHRTRWCRTDEGGCGTTIFDPPLQEGCTTPGPRGLQHPEADDLSRSRTGAAHDARG